MPDKFPEHVQEVVDGGLECRHCHGIVGDDGFALTLDVGEESEPQERGAPFDEKLDDATFAEAVTGRMP